MNNWSKMSDRDQQNRNTQNYKFWVNCWKCGIFGHSTNEWQINSTMANQDQTYKVKLTFRHQNQLGIPPHMSPAKPPVLTQQITTDFKPHGKHGINLAVTWLKWQKQTIYYKVQLGTHTKWIIFQIHPLKCL